MIKQAQQEEVVEVRAVWEAPAIVEYDAKAEIQGVQRGVGEFFLTRTS